MKIIAVNGSPRKKHNTALLLEKALEGAASAGAETEMVHLYDLDYKGCTSCFACKRTGGSSYGRCAMKDGLSQVLENIAIADAVVLGSPIYYGNVTGEMRSFLERLQFQYLRYDSSYSSLFTGKLSAAFIYTMNVNEQMYENSYRSLMQTQENVFKRVLKADNVFTLASTDTHQFDDYSKYDVTLFDPVHKKRRKQEIFPEDCSRAFEIGVKLAAK